MPSTESLNNEFYEMRRRGRYAEILERLRLLTGFDQLYKIYWSLIAYYNIGQIEDGIDYFKINEKVIENDGRDFLKPKIWNTAGKLFYKNGKSLTAYEFFQKAFEMAINLNLSEDLSIALNNLGTVNMSRGNLDKSLEFYEKCLKKAIDENDIVLQSDTLYNIGNIHFLRKELETARNFYLDCLKLRRSIGNETKIALTLKSLVEVEFESQDPDFEVINFYSSEMRMIANAENTDLIMLYYMYTKALIYKWEGDFTKSEMIFRDIIDENQESEITVSSILNLIEILFIEYKESLDEEILKSIHYFLDKMFIISKNQFSFRYLIKSLILKSQIMSIEGDFDEAYLLIEKALKSTEDHKMEYLRNEILRLKENLTNEYEKLKMLFEENSPMVNRLNTSSIMDLLKDSRKI